jgi:flagellar biosynthetic protein FliQ
MTSVFVIGMGRETLYTAMALAAPVLLVGLVVGLVVAIFQAVTSIQEQTLSIIPKMLAVSLTLLVLMPWMLNRIVSYTAATFDRMAGVGG